MEIGRTPFVCATRQVGTGLNYYQADGLGSITSMTDSTGLPSATFVYGAFGVLSSSTGSVNNSYRYTAREFDQDTGLYYYRARYYDSATGRFLTEDPTRFTAGANFYSYVGNGPTSHIDPFGLQQQGTSCGVGPVYEPDQWNPGGACIYQQLLQLCRRRLVPSWAAPTPNPGNELGLGLPPDFRCLDVKVNAR